MVLQIGFNLDFVIIHSQVLICLVRCSYHHLFLLPIVLVSFSCKHLASPLASHHHMHISVYYL